MNFDYLNSENDVINVCVSVIYVIVLLFVSFVIWGCLLNSVSKIEICSSLKNRFVINFYSVVCRYVNCCWNFSWVSVRYRLVLIVGIFKKLFKVIFILVVLNCGM